MYADVNLAFGDIVKVTPSSKVVGDLAIFLVSHDMTVHDLENLPADHNLTLPNSVVGYVHGIARRTGRRLAAEAAAALFFAAKTPNAGRPGEHLPPVDLGQDGNRLSKNKPARPAART